MTSSLGFRLSLRLSVLVLLISVLLSLCGLEIAYRALLRRQGAEKQRELLLRAEMYQALYAADGLDAVRSWFDQQQRTGRDFLFVRIAGSGSTALLLKNPEGAAAFDAEAFANLSPSFSGGWRSREAGGRSLRWFVASARLTDGRILQTGESLSFQKKLAAMFRRFAFSFVLPALLLNALCCFFLAFYGLKPVRSLAEALSAGLSSGNAYLKSPARGQQGEFALLSKLFAQLLEKNKALIQAMHNSLDNVAHDLRTPLTRLRSSAEFALQHPDDTRAAQEALADCMEESERVLTILGTLMDVAEAETGVMTLEISEVSLPEVIRAVADLYELVADEKHIQITLDLPGELTVPADRTRVQQLLANLLDNALKYSGNGRLVTISAKANNDWAQITVADQGIGISRQEQERIWDRLFRGDRSRSERGLGLGLSFVKAVVEAHGGTVTVESELNKGSAFTVRLPLGRR